MSLTIESLRGCFKWIPTTEQTEATTLTIPETTVPPEMCVEMNGINNVEILPDSSFKNSRGETVAEARFPESGMTCTAEEVLSDSCYLEIQMGEYAVQMSEITVDGTAHVLEVSLKTDNTSPWISEGVSTFNNITISIIIQ